MNPVVTRLKQRIYDSNGKLRPGALSRASERIGVTRGTIQRWVSGKWQPGTLSLATISSMLADPKMSFLGKKRGPKVSPREAIAGNR